MSRARGDGGTAVVEFVVLTLAVTVPVAYALGTVLDLHSQRSTAQSAASAAALLVARHGGGQARVDQTVRGFWDDPADVTASLGCRPECGRPGALVTVTVEVRVPSAVIPGGVTLTQQNAQVVDRFVAR